MQDLKVKVDEAGSFLKEKTKITPEVGIILGTGLGALAEEIEQEAVIPYD